MKHQSYYTRAMKAGDRRYARIFGKLGYDTTQIVADDGEPDLEALRSLYQEVVGKRPYHGWDAATLSAKIAEKKANGG
ncbi:hypothetical protein NUH86_16010 [Sphingobium sp. JS3065]|uniref:hypothetical protein n=1 Tax=Sphingobium sp. JS3065 TaxID=2970925 RepID=UPI0022652AA9|nr:hypothetical protein [Sphingobium sp. JS3065]UZW54959.1 hypothetical protein NUH86_16010 [Sphingobium sp. JS3065]